MHHDQDKAVTRPKDESTREDIPNGGTSLTVYFDGSCPLSTAEISQYAAQCGGERPDFVDVSREVNAIRADLAPRDAMGRFHVRRPDGPLMSGAHAFAAIWEALPGWRWAARIAALPGIPTALECAYRLFPPVRPALSKIASLLGAKPASACPHDE